MGLSGVGGVSEGMLVGEVMTKRNRARGQRLKAFHRKRFRVRPHEEPRPSPGPHQPPTDHLAAPPADAAVPPSHSFPPACSSPPTCLWAPPDLDLPVREFSFGSHPFILCNRCSFLLSLVEGFKFLVIVLSTKKFSEYSRYIRMVIVGIFVLHLLSSRGFDEPSINPPETSVVVTFFSIGRSSMKFSPGTALCLTAPVLSIS